MVVSSSLNNGTIRLGSSRGPASVTADTVGIYMDGNGDFQVFGDADNFIRFDVSDSLKIAAENFELDAGGLKLIGNSSTQLIQLIESLKNENDRKYKQKKKIPKKIKDLLQSKD